MIVRSAPHTAVLCYRDGRQRTILIRTPAPSVVVERESPTTVASGPSPLRGCRFRRGSTRDGLRAYLQEPGAVPPTALRCNRCHRFADLAYVQRAEGHALGVSTPSVQLCVVCYLALS